MLEPTMTIAGKAEAGQETFPVLNPANGQVIGTLRSAPRISWTRP